MLIAGIVSLVASAVLLLIGRNQSGKALEMSATETTSASELNALTAGVSAEIGPGSFSQKAEVKGEIQTDNSLTAEMSGTPCVYYACTVTREYEESYYETDANGNRSQRTRRGSEQVSRNVRSTLFFVADASGRILVDPTDAQFVAEKIVSRFEQGPGASRLSIGGFSIDLGGILPTQGRRTLGYRLEEEAIPVGRQVYVLGEAADDGGQLRIRKPTAKGNRFIVSLKSEEQLVSQAKKASAWLAIAAIVCAFAGISLTLAGVIVQ